MMPSREWIARFAQRLRRARIRSRTFDADPDTDLLTTRGPHRLEAGQGPLILAETAHGPLPAGLSTGTEYWPGLVDATRLRLATSPENVASESWVDVTGAGVGRFVWP